MKNTKLVLYRYNQGVNYAKLSVITCLQVITYKNK